MIVDEKRVELFLEQFHNDEIHNTDPLIVINHQLLDQYYYEFNDELVYDYNGMIKQLERIANNRRIQANETTIKFRNVRPVIPIAELHQEYNNKFVSFEGLVKNRSIVHNMITQAHWKCRECGQDRVFEMNHGEKVVQPKGACFRCQMTKGYDLDKVATVFKDVQLLKVQEPLSNMSGVFQPPEIKVYLEDDMVDIVKPGDMVRINGVLRLQNKKNDNLFSEYVTAEYVEKLDQDFEDIIITPEEEKQIRELSKRDNLFSIMQQSVLPSVYGHEEVKEAIALYLFSSDSTLMDEDHDFERGDIHILLIGDPGVAKSQILKRVAQLAPRGIYTSGKGSSGAGLTATAVKDELGSWSLEAGAMVLADKGNICIDEFDKMREEDRSAIHEALEQQTISISKAGITTTLNSRCSVLAAANPKYGNFNPYKTVKEQITLSSPILSRFDFIFILQDTPESEQDMNIAISILMKDFQNDDKIPFDLLRKYISYARKNVHPVMTFEVAKRLGEFYTNWRTSAVVNNNPIPITARQLTAMSRVAKASARARLSDKVELEDAERAIRLQEFCMTHVGFDIETDSPNATQAMGMNGGVKEEMNEDRMNELTEELSVEWDNHIPINILQKTLRSKGFRDEVISKWLSNLDEEGDYYYDSEGYLNKL